MILKTENGFKIKPGMVSKLNIALENDPICKPENVFEIRPDFDPGCWGGGIKALGEGRKITPGGGRGDRQEGHGNRP